jgi:hypothetical protein
MLDAELEKQSESAIMAARAAAWRRFIDTVWAGDSCAHAAVDLLKTCRTCGEQVADREK